MRKNRNTLSAAQQINLSKFPPYLRPKKFQSEEDQTWNSNRKEEQDQTWNDYMALVHDREL